MLAPMPQWIAPPPPAPALRVVALCAAWCGTCRDYAVVFAARAARDAAAGYLWLDIEDDADWVDALDVEDFPTLLVLRDGAPLFFGPLRPQPEVLDRTVEALGQAVPLPAQAAPELHALGARLAALASR